MHSILLRYVFHSIPAPRCYVYEDNRNKRPDILIVPAAETAPIVTDITIVSNREAAADHRRIGEAATRAAQDKIAYHRDAVERAGHRFFAMALEPSGFMHRDGVAMIKQLSKSLPYHLQIDFMRDMHASINMSLARFRAAAVINATSSWDQPRPSLMW